MTTRSRTERIMASDTGFASDGLTYKLGDSIQVQCWQIATSYPPKRPRK